MCNWVRSEVLILSILFLNPHALYTMPNPRQCMFFNHTVFGAVLLL